MSHTPGPWEFIASNMKQWIVGAKNWTYDIAIVRNIGMEDNHANARLIAAAPDLLQALEGVLRVADRATVEFDAARAAIAKAKGEKHEPR